MEPKAGADIANGQNKLLFSNGAGQHCHNHKCFGNRAPRQKVDSYKSTSYDSAGIHARKRSAEGAERNRVASDGTWFLSSRKQIPMPFAGCPRCSHQLQYLPEQAGMSGICPACGVDMALRQDSRQIARMIVGVTVAALSFAGLGFFGLMGGIVALASGGGVAVAFALVAVYCGMKIRSVLQIFAIYLVLAVLGAAMVALESRYARKKRADGAIASPFFAIQKSQILSRITDA
jgi:hypothetical protein